MEITRKNEGGGELRVLLIGASGYLGSRFARDIGERGWGLDGCDRNPPVEGLEFDQFFITSFADLTEDTLKKYSIVLWFAGHSTVATCASDPLGSVQNNLVDLIQLSTKLNALSIPLVYASTASIYSSDSNEYSMIANERRSNIYDASKLSLDLVISGLQYRATALRLATVAGWAPHMRWDTIFNAMNRSAYRDGKVSVSNPSNFRSIVFIDELSKYVMRMVDLASAGAGAEFPKQIPLACWSGSIGSLAAEIAEFWDVPIYFGEDSGTYSFVVPDRYMFTALGSPKDFYISTAARCRKLAQQMNWKLPNKGGTE